MSTPQTFVASFMATVAIFLSSCSYIVVGDSTMAQIAAVNGQEPGHVRGGCSISGEGGYPEPCRIELAIPHRPKVVIGISIWDVGVDDVSGYRSVVDAYQWAGASVVIVALPEVSKWHASPETIASLNRRVAEATGCPIYPASIRVAATTDGVHYTDAAAIEVAQRFELIDHNEWSCPFVW